jgi:hypothetical protein
MTAPYKYTSTGSRYIPGFTSFTTDYLNEMAWSFSVYSNRLYGDIMVLPEQYTDIKIKPNVPITANTINTAIRGLYNNYVYILTRCKIGKTDAFESYRGATGIPATIYSQPLTAAFAGDSDRLEESKINNMLGEDVNDTIMTRTLGQGVYGYIIATGNKLKIFKFAPIDLDMYNSTLRAVSTDISEALIDSSSDLKFENISKLALSNRDELYVLDSTTRVIYKYNIKGLTRNDRILMSRRTPGRQLVGYMGGRGTTGDKTTFNSPIDMTFADGLLYILDTDTRDVRVKVYDSQFNWISTYNLSLDYLHDTPVSFAINKGTLYILTELGDINQYTLTDLESSIMSSTTVPANIIDHDFATQEVYGSIQFSPTNTNLCYILTNKNIYKKYDDRLDKTAATIDWEKHHILTGTTGRRRRVKVPSPEPKVVSFITRSDAVEDIMLVNVIHNYHGLLLHFKENENLMDMISEEYETDIYPLSSIYIKPEEYVSSFVYNKAIAKLLFNTNLIYSNIRHVASSELDALGGYMYPGIRYLSEQEINTYRDQAVTLDVYVGVNEVLTTGVLNRCIKTVTDEQNKILQLVKDRKNAPDFYTAGSIKLKKFPIPHLDYTLPSGRSFKIQKI